MITTEKEYRILKLIWHDDPDTGQDYCDEVLEEIAYDEDLAKVYCGQLNANNDRSNVEYIVETLEYKRAASE